MSTGTPTTSVLLEIAAGGPDVTVTASAHQSPAETHGHGLRAICCPELAEQPPRVGLHGVLGQIELLADLRVAPAAAHASQHLQLALGQRREPLGIGAGAR